MTIYCPTFLPTPITGEIGGQWNTAQQPGRAWQLGYAWLEHDELVHVVFEGYPGRAWPVDCEGVPCFAHIVGRQRIGPFQVTWYDHNQASHTGHIAAVFRANGNVYVVSMHIAAPAAPESKTKALVARMVAGLVPITPTV
jgi:hypothetical protein